MITLEEMNNNMIALENTYSKEINILNNKVEQLTNLVIDFLSNKDMKILSICGYIIYCQGAVEDYHSTEWQYTFEKNN